MAYTPVDGGNIIASFVTSGVYTPVDGSNITANFTTVTPLGRRALLFYDGMLRQIADAEIGTGRKPVKTIQGAFLIVVGIEFRTLGTNEVIIV